jgi:tRNA U55 pseudouridine synthase TruB
VRDLGDILECGATVMSLERSEIGPFTKDISIPGYKILNADRNFLEKNVIPVSRIEGSFTSYKVKVSDEPDVLSGQGVPLKDLERISWGKYSSDNCIIIQGKNFTSFGNISNISGVSFVCPKTTIFSGEID